MGKMYLNGTPYSTEITESRFNYDLLLENTNFTITSGTGNVDRTYTLSNPIDNYDAVMVFGYMLVNGNNRNQIASMMIMNKDFYTTPLISSNYAFMLNGTIANAPRRLCFRFTDSTHIATSTSTKVDTEEPRLWKVYGLKFPNETGIKNNDIPIYLGSQLLYKDRISTNSTSKTGFFCSRCNTTTHDADTIQIARGITVPSGYEIQYKLSAVLNSQNCYADVYINSLKLLTGRTNIGTVTNFLGHYGVEYMSNLFRFQDIASENRYIDGNSTQSFNYYIASTVNGQTAWAENVTIHAYLVKKYWH